MKKGLRPFLFRHVVTSRKRAVRIDTLMKKGLKRHSFSINSRSMSVMVRIDSLMKKGLKIDWGAVCLYFVVSREGSGMNKNLALVLTIGGSPEPVIKSLSEHDAGYIYLIPSIGSENQISLIVEKAYPRGCHAVKKTFAVADPDDLQGCYRRCLEVFEDIRKMSIEDRRIVADPTGGTKIMSSALLLAAVDRGIKVAYVTGTERNKDGLGVVVSGKERIVYNDHPFDLVARTLKERLCSCFNSYRFEAAIIIGREIENRTGEKLGSIMKALVKISEGYRDWDLFRYKNCARTLESGLESLRRLSIQYHADIERLSVFIAAVASNIRHLNTLPHDSVSPELVAEMVANSCRRSEEGKYDDAVARLYRALEMIAQWRFQEVFGQSTTKFPLSKLDDKIRAEFYPNKPKETLKDIPMKRAFEILDRSGDRIGGRFMENYDGRIQKILDRRNKSILAHGAEPLDKADFDRLYRIFREVFEIDGSDIRFARLDAEAFLPIGL
jgi:CRISPR-associated protein (TIGR02710 family)